MPDALRIVTITADGKPEVCSYTDDYKAIPAKSDIKHRFNDTDLAGFSRCRDLLAYCINPYKHQMSLQNRGEEIHDLWKSEGATSNMDGNICKALKRTIKSRHRDWQESTIEEEITFIWQYLELYVLPCHIMHENVDAK